MKVEIGQLYQHYRTKGLYRIIAPAYDESDLSQKVVYEYVGEGKGSDGKDHFPLGTVRVRGLESFVGQLEFDGILVSRFVLINEK